MVREGRHTSGQKTHIRLRNKREAGECARDLVGTAAGEELCAEFQEPQEWTRKALRLQEGYYSGKTKARLLPDF